MEFEAGAQAARVVDANVWVARQDLVQRDQQHRARVQVVHRSQHLGLRSGEDRTGARSAREWACGRGQEKL